MIYYQIEFVTFKTTRYICVNLVFKQVFGDFFLLRSIFSCDDYDALTKKSYSEFQFLYFCYLTRLGNIGFIFEKSSTIFDETFFRVLIVNE
jgi:hypothetical protein